MGGIICNNSYFEKFTPALFIHERYELNKNKENFSEENKKNFDNWIKRKTILNNENFEEILLTQNYKKNIFSESINYEKK